jgi:hypothetical protein
VPTMSGPTVAAPPPPTGTVVYPTQAPTAPVPTLEQPQVYPTKRPEDPHRVTSMSSPNRDVSWLVPNSAIVALGQVQVVHPAQWSTPNGQRPANPHVDTPEAFIYRPVQFAVEQRLAGQDAGNVLHLYAAGGQVGQDWERVEPGDIYQFSPGERAIVFLIPPWAQIARTWNGYTLWVPREHYTVTAGGRARTIERNIPLQQLLDEIAAAQA